MATPYLGGESSPLGQSIQFVEADFETVLDEHLKWRRSLNKIKVSRPRPLQKAFDEFLPFESPWTRELLFRCGRWTAYLNNWVNGGDTSASILVTARELNVRHVVALHSNRNSAGHASTQLWVHADHEYPFRGSRTISAYPVDGRWQWHEFGDPLPFEEIERYGMRLKRERFDREMLLRYLAALEIPIEDPSQFGQAVVVQEKVEGKRRTQTLAEARADR